MRGDAGSRSLDQRKALTMAVKMACIGSRMLADAQDLL
jgi:hypothetical protein